MKYSHKITMITLNYFTIQFLYRHICLTFASPANFQDAKGDQFRKRDRVIQGSEILTTKYISILLKWLRVTKSKSKYWTLCYKASKDGWSSTDFHSKCDNVGPTIVVIQSTNGNIFGGFNAEQWTSSRTHTIDNDCFLFTLKNTVGLSPTKINTNPGQINHCYSTPKYGPTFGGRHDLYICSNPNTNNSSYSNLGDTYDLPGYTYGSSQIKQVLAGSYYFTVAEIEVFKIK